MPSPRGGTGLPYRTCSLWFCPSSPELTRQGLPRAPAPCSPAAQEVGSPQPASRGRGVTVPRRVPALFREVTKLSCVPQASFCACPDSSTRCGCSGGGGSMARVWGTTAPARLALLLLLMAMCYQETCAAPWRAPGAGGWAEMGPNPSGTRGEKSGLLSLWPYATLPQGWLPCRGVLGGRDRQHRGRWVRACGSTAPQGWLQPCRATALPLAGWSTAFTLGMS